MSAGQPLDMSSIYQPPSFSTPWSALIVNGLWFVSLFLSLLAAVLGMLSKEWLSAYNDRIETVPLERVRQRQFRYTGLKTWMVPSIISFLPLAIHVAVFLFFTGVVIFVWPLSMVLASLLAAILLVGLALYVTASVLPFIWADCPYKSPLYNWLKLVVLFLRRGMDTLQRYSFRLGWILDPETGHRDALSLWQEQDVWERQCIKERSVDLQT
ncbi:hypothetical protein CALCODRAFT_527275, partial [Calocera cornea HHB12733]